MPDQEFVVQDVLGPVAFRGEIIAEAKHRNGDPGQPIRRRWTDMTLYRVTEPNSRWRYAVHNVGRSVVYHHGTATPCREARSARWTRTTVKELHYADLARYEELLPCLERGCKPAALRALDDDYVIAIESDAHKLLTATSAKNIIHILYKEHGKVNTLAAGLLQEAAKVNDQIHQAITAPRRLG